MNAISTNYGAGFAATAPQARPGSRSDTAGTQAQGPEAPASHVLGLGLQLSRASAMALTRLQLALCTGERRQALEAIDRLHALDTQLEGLVAKLDAAPADDQDWQALSTHLSDQKLALAFEKLALASGISGPDLTSTAAQPAGLAQPAPRPTEFGDEPPPLVDWRAFPAAQPAEWNPFANRAFAAGVAVVLALVVTAILAAAAVMMTGAG